MMRLLAQEPLVERGTERVTTRFIRQVHQPL
jgi:hypothetical protein